MKLFFYSDNIYDIIDNRGLYEWWTKRKNSIIIKYGFAILFILINMFNEFSNNIIRAII